MAKDAVEKMNGIAAKPKRSHPLGPLNGQEITQTSTLIKARWPSKERLHFKAITLMTPVQYRTQTRLQEARRLMIVEGKPAGVVAASVGYDTQSQFTRDYKRLFGAPPATDAARVSGQDARA